MSPSRAEPSTSLPVLHPIFSAGLPCLPCHLLWLWSYSMHTVGVQQMLNTGLDGWEGGCPRRSPRPVLVPQPPALLMPRCPGAVSWGPKSIADFHFKQTHPQGVSSGWVRTRSSTGEENRTLNWVEVGGGEAGDPPVDYMPPFLCRRRAGGSGAGVCPHLPIWGRGCAELGRCAAGLEGGAAAGQGGMQQNR